VGGNDVKPLSLSSLSFSVSQFLSQNEGMRAGVERSTNQLGGLGAGVKATKLYGEHSKDLSTSRPPGQCPVTLARALCCGRMHKHCLRSQGGYIGLRLIHHQILACVGALHTFLATEQEDDVTC